MRRRRPPQPMFPRAALVAAVLLLGACGPLAPRPPSTVKLPPVQDSFEASGRMSARHGSDALAANFHWQHAGERDALELASPLGQTIALMSGDGAAARLQSADGRVLDAGNWTKLTEAGLGWPLPVEGLKYWIQGAARADAAFTAEADEEGRASVLRQDGWTIVYLAFAADHEGVSRPTRMMLSYPDVEVRLVVDTWQ